MIRSSKTSLKFSNTGKLNCLEKFRSEYQIVCQELVDRMWLLDHAPSFMPNDPMFKVESWLSARAIQACGKQASAIVRGTKQKNKQRQFILDKALKEGDSKTAKRLQTAILKNPIGLPNLKNVDPQLDSRFVSQEFGSKGFFDGWISLTSLGEKLKIVLPIKRTKHFNHLEKLGNIASGLRIGRYDLTFSFDIPDPKIRSEGSTIGVDIGATTLVSCSDNQVSVKDAHGWDMSLIMKKLVRKTRGSVGFRKAQDHRKNYIGWAINRLNLDGKKQINLENIKDLRKNKRTSKFLQRWTYTDVFRKLAGKAEELGVPILLKNPRYTSQRCSGCGWVQKANRVCKAFKCKSCGFSLDSDLNAAKNLAACLRPLKRAEFQKGASKEGFYWGSEGSDNIVPDTLKTISVE